MEKFIKITDLDQIKVVEAISREELVEVLNGRTKWLLNITKDEFFNASKNEWQPFEKAGEFDY